MSEREIADRLIGEAISRIEAGCRVGVGLNWYHVFLPTEPHDRRKAIDVIGKRGSDGVCINVWTGRDHFEYPVSPDSAQRFWSAYDAHEKQLRDLALANFAETTFPAPKPRRSLFRFWKRPTPGASQ